MKSLTAKLMMAAAAVTVVAGAASAQVMKAEVPFTFHVGPTTMAAGTYHVRVSSLTSVKTIQMRNGATGKSILILPKGMPDSEREATAKLLFECRAGDCSLAKVWTGDGESYRIFPPKAPKYLQAELRIVTIDLQKGE
jgi:hypothetical protein